MQPSPSGARTDRHLALWLAGALVAVAGAALARWGAPLVQPSLFVWLRLAGVTLVMLGLLTVALATGARARARTLSQETSSESTP